MSALRDCARAYRLRDSGLVQDVATNRQEAESIAAFLEAARPRIAQISLGGPVQLVILETLEQLYGPTMLDDEQRLAEATRARTELKERR
jgi:hypothetical protein